MSTQPHLPVDLAGAPESARPTLELVRDVATEVDFDGFVRRYENRLQRLVQRRLGDVGEAEEIAQETLLRAYQHRASFSTEDELIAWCTVVAQRLVIDRARVRGRSIAVAEVPENARLGRDTADIVVARQQARIALESLEALPTRQAAILWAREVEGLHYEEIAERFGLTEPTVRSLLHRGRKALRKEYAGRGGSLPLGSLVPLAPWLIALKSLGKLRRAAGSAAKSPAAAISTLGLVGVTALSLGVSLGIGGPATNAPAVRPLPHVVIESVASAAVPAASGPRAAAAPRAAAPDGGSAAQAPPSTPAQQVIHKVPTTCVPGKTTSGVAGGSGATCIESKRNPEGYSLWVGPPLPANPTGVRRVGVAQDVVACEQIPGTPLSGCDDRYADGSSPLVTPNPPVNPALQGAQR